MQGHSLCLRKKHLFYSNHEHKLDKHNRCHGLEFEDMVIPREDFKGQHFPYGSILDYFLRRNTRYNAVLFATIS